MSEATAKAFITDPEGSTSAADVRDAIGTIYTDLSGYPTFSGALVRKSGNQAINATTETPLTWDSEDYDTDDYHDNSTDNDRLTIPTDGTYIAGAGIILSGGATETTLYLKLDDTSYETILIVSVPTSSPASAVTSPPLVLTAGQFFTAAVFFRAARTVVSSTATYFWVRRIA